MSLASDVLGAMITPAVLISACGTLVLSTSNRLTRVVDRVRALATEAGHLAPVPAGGRDRRGFILEQVALLSRRVLLLRSALANLYFAIGLLVTCSIVIGGFGAFGITSPWLPVGLGLAGAATLLAGSLLLIREAQIAVASTLQEMSEVRAMVEARPGLR